MRRCRQDSSAPKSFLKVPRAWRRGTNHSRFFSSRLSRGAGPQSTSPLLRGEHADDRYRNPVTPRIAVELLRRFKLGNRCVPRLRHAVVPPWGCYVRVPDFLIRCVSWSLEGMSLPLLEPPTSHRFIGKETSVMLVMQRCACRRAILFVECEAG